jgi:hypothetical protein
MAATHWDAMKRQKVMQAGYIFAGLGPDFHKFKKCDCFPFVVPA